jgi:adenylosuccinate lyase
MLENLDRTQGLVFSQKLLLALIDAGMSRDAAYRFVQRHSMTAWHERRPLRQLVEGDPEVAKRLDAGRLDEVFDVRSYLEHVDESFRRIGLL